jgi:hypothetical protein
MEGYWNGEDATVRCCIVVLKEAITPNIGPGERVRAVEVRPHEASVTGNRVRTERTTKLGDPIYLLDEDGSGWANVTRGRGSVGWPRTEIQIDGLVQYLPDRIEQG